MAAAMAHLDPTKKLERHHRCVGLQAVILCGPGTSLYPFTGKDDLPKALLPMANKPMLYYPLDFAEKAGFDSILVLTLAEHESVIATYVRAHHPKKPHGLRIQISSTSKIDDCLGTADAIRAAYEKGWLNSDFCVLPCDLVTTLEPAKVVELWMTQQASFDADFGRRSKKGAHAGEFQDGRRGGMCIFYDTMGEGAQKGQEQDYVAYEPTAKATAISNLPEGEVGALLDTQSMEDVREDGLRLRKGLLRRGNLKLVQTYRDSGIYFFPHWVLKFIDRNKELHSLREDILPFLAKARWQNPRLADKLGLLDLFSASDDQSSDSGLTRPEYDLGAMSSTRHPIKPAADRLTIPSITVYLPKVDSTFIRRVDTPHLYLFSSLYLASSSEPKVGEYASIDKKAHITQADSLIGEKAKIGERAVIKKSVIGAGCTIARGVRLIGCVLMDGASVGENSKLESCTVGRNAKIGSKVALNNCAVAEGFDVESGYEAKNETLVEMTGMDELSEEDDYEEDESEDEL